MPKLMLVEDDNNLREIYEARLQAEGYTIVSARDGEEALVVAKAEKPDLIVSDVMMPKISGFEMLDILRNTEEMKDVKIIMLTALGQSDDQQRADRLGADRYLVKSQVTLEDIVKVTHELLQDQPAKEAGGASLTPTPPPVAPPAPAAPVTPAAAPTPAPATTPAAPVAAAPAATPVVAAPTPTPAPATDVPAAATPAPTTPPVPVVPAPEPAVPAAVIAEPAPEPTPDPIPEPQPAATPSPEPAAVATANDAQSTAQEENTVDAQIEDFVAGATQEPTTPTETAETTAGEATAPAEEVAVESPAVDEEAAPAPAEAPALEPTPTLATTPVIKVQASTRSASQPGTETEVIQPEQASTSMATAPKGTGSVPIAHKKVIAPIPTGEEVPKKDIGTLLALEEAKQAVAAGPPAPTAIVATDEAGAAAMPLTTTPETPTPGPADPSSIAL